jgi:hypothetical protein
MVEEPLCPTIRSSKTAKEVWEKLEQTYEDKGLTRRLGLLRRLFCVKLEDHQNMEKYLNEILSLTQKLTATEAEIKDEFIGVTLLNGLRNEYGLYNRDRQHNHEGIDTDST